MSRRAWVIAMLGIPAIGFASSASELMSRFVISATYEQIDLGPGDGSANPTAGVVTMNTVPWTKVVIDGEVRGTTPLFRLRMMPGQHSVRFVNEEQNISDEVTVDVASGYLTKVRGTLATAAGEQSELQSARRPTEIKEGVGDLVNPAFLTVDSVPWGHVYLDGQLIGTTPLYKSRIASGEHSLEIRNANSGSVRSVHVKATSGELVKFKFEAPSLTDNTKWEKLKASR